MKNRFLLYTAAISMAIVLMSGIANLSHSPGKKSGSPGDGANCTACHAGNTQTASNWITSNIPSSGYTPGSTYTITLTGTHSGVAKFGFELTAEDASNAKVGTFIITNSTETEFTNANHAVTHTGNGVNPSNNSKSWSFDWTAPAAGTGDITFYASLNAADGNGHPSGDVIYDTHTTFTEDVSASINSSSNSNSFSIYPNPVNNILNIKLSDSEKYDIQISDVNGKIIMKKTVLPTDKLSQISVADLPQGVYFINVIKASNTFSKKFVKQ